MNNNKRLAFNLQRFATQTTLLPGLSDEMKTFYSMSLIDMAEPNLVHDQFADKYPIPANGGKSIEFRKYDSLAKALTPLTEGVTPAGNSLNVSTITATVDQYGDFIELSDVLKLTAIDNNVVQALKILGSQAGRTLDTITRDVVAGGTNVIYANGAASRAALTSADTLKVKDIFRAVAQLDAMNTPKINGSYVAIVHPYVAFDLMTSPEFQAIHQYTDSGVQALYNGEIGRIGGVRFVESTEAKIWDASNEGSDPCPSGLSVFGTIVLGSGAYATTDVTGGGLETIVKQLGEGQDPLNQRSTVGWKAIKTAERLIEQYMVRIESVSAYSSTASAN